VLVTDKSYTEMENKELRGNKQQNMEQISFMQWHTQLPVSTCHYITLILLKKQRWTSQDWH